MPAPAELLIVIRFRALKPEQARTVWNTGAAQRTTMVTTFLARLLKNQLEQTGAIDAPPRRATNNEWADQATCCIKKTDQPSGPSSS